MSHDVKKNKFLKKILGALGFKIFPKETIKTERFIESSSINSGDLIKLLINKKKINNIIQIGANDGKSDDFLRTSINADTNVLLVEPIKSAFEQLEKNYSSFTNVNCDKSDKNSTLFSSFNLPIGIPALNIPPDPEV